MILRGIFLNQERSSYSDYIRWEDSDKPEEIAHQLVFKLDSMNENLVWQNLQHAACALKKAEKIQVVILPMAAWQIRHLKKLSAGTLISILNSLDYLTERFR